jgi:hypothetical protein
MTTRAVYASRAPMLGLHIVRPRRTSKNLSNSTWRDPAPVPACPRITVPGIERDIQIKIASEWVEWEQAFELLADSYRARGYEAPSDKPYRFTPYHILPDTITLVAMHQDRVVATLSLVPDTSLLGLPMESIYAGEIGELRRQRRRMAEAISLADQGLTIREFIQVFQTGFRLGMQYHVSQGGDTWVMTVNPRHRSFYQKVMGFVPLGPCRYYPSVQDHPAEAYWLDIDRMRAQAPKMHQEVFGERLPEGVLTTPSWSAERVRAFGHRSTQTDARMVDELVLQVEHLGSPPRWQENGKGPDRFYRGEWVGGRTGRVEPCGCWR